MQARASAKKFPGGRADGKKIEKQQKKAENSTIKPLFSNLYNV